MPRRCAASHPKVAIVDPGATARRCAPAPFRARTRDAEAAERGGEAIANLLGSDFETGHRLGASRFATGNRIS
jgi:hypothetical protein